MAIEDCRDRNHIPRVHVYPHHLFIVIHAPEIGTGGHVHYLELDQFLGERFLVTVHGPLNPKVPLEAALRETQAVAERMERGRLQPTSPFGLTYAIVSSIARREAALAGEIARQVGLLEQRVMAASDEEPQEFLTELFTARHELLTIRTMAAQGGEIYRRAIKLTTFAPPERAEADEGPAGPVRERRLDQPGSAGLPDGGHRVLPGPHRHQDDHRCRTAGGDRRGHPADHSDVVDRGHERDRQRSTHWVLLTILLVFMSTMSFILLRWAKRQGWW